LTILDTSSNPHSTTPRRRRGGRARRLSIHSASQDREAQPRPSEAMNQSDHRSSDLRGRTMLDHIILTVSDIKRSLDGADPNAADDVSPPADGDVARLMIEITFVAKVR
ncbi:MAG TPA: hypothetical protein VNZ26_06925, partial [Vicinamibacterales bacterium]|nr:hypothetical protein [Vicinamibacterales bacterium]